jgi:hypothetical protein
MKKTLVIAGLAVLSTNAFASKARMEALGQGSASYYIQDSRSIFINPAMVNETKNYIVTEWGVGANTDSSVAPRAEGGFFREMGTFSYGLYLGNNDSAQAHSGTGATYLAQTNAMDLFVGGDMGMKWGAKVHYAGGKDDGAAAANVRKHDALGIGLGVVHGDIEGYANIGLSDKSTGNATTAANESKISSDLTLGGSYKFSGWTFYADYSTSKLEETGAVANKDTTIQVGAGRVHEIASGSRLFTDVTYSSGTSEAATKIKTTALPVNFGMEIDASSWLTVRGSVGQNVILGTVDTAGRKVDIANSTAVNAGATLNFGKLKVDGMVGNTGPAGAHTVAGGAVTSKTGVLSTSNLLSRVGVTYNF